MRFPMASQGFYIVFKTFGRTMTLGSTQPLNRRVPVISPEGKGGRCVWLTTLTPSSADCLYWNSFNLERSHPTEGTA